MGCTSSKPKKTKSLDDIQAGIKGSTVNGQVTKEDPAVKKVVAGDQHQSTNPIQIPGANKSFLAPDGIPFIDEDVDDDDIRLRSGKTDINKNSKPEEAIARNSALVNAAVVDKCNVQMTNSKQEAVQVPKSQVAPPSSIKDEEAAIKIQAGIRGFLDRKKVHAMKESMAVSNDSEEIEQPAPNFDENIAATKIQASYRGYRTRKEIHYGDK